MSWVFYVNDWMSANTKTSNQWENIFFNFCSRYVLFQWSHPTSFGGKNRGGAKKSDFIENGIAFSIDVKREDRDLKLLCAEQSSFQETVSLSPILFSLSASIRTHWDFSWSHFQITHCVLSPVFFCYHWVAITIVLIRIHFGSKKIGWKCTAFTFYCTNSF